MLYAAAHNVMGCCANIMLQGDTMTTATATHKVFAALQGLWPVTFANVREADPEGLLDIFEGAEGTRDQYLSVVIAHTRTQEPLWIQRNTAGRLWAESLEGLGTDHTDACYRSDGWKQCRCKDEHYNLNHRWGTELFAAIQQRIEALNG